MIGIPLSLVFGGPLSGWIMQNSTKYLGPARLAVDVPRRGRACGAARLRRAGLPHRKTRRGPLAVRLSNAPGSRERIEAEHQEAHARHGVNLRAALTHPTVWLLADRDVLLPDRQLWPHLLGAVHRQGPVRIHRVRGGHCSPPSRISRPRWACCWWAGARIAPANDSCTWRLPSLFGALGFLAVGYMHVTRAGDAGAVRRRRRRLLARAARSGHCPASFWSAAPPRAPSRSSIPWARSAASSARAPWAGSRIRPAVSSDPC